MLSVRRCLAVPFVRDVATLQVGQLVAIGCNFLTSVLYARLLGLSSYGQYAVVLAFTAIFGMFTNLGQQTTAITFLAETYAARDRRGMAQVMHYYVWMSVGTIALLSIFILLLPQLSEWLYGARFIGELGRLVFLASILDMPFIFLTIVLQTVRRIRLLTLLENTYVIFQMAITALLVLLGMGVSGILLGSAAASLVFSVVGLVLYGRIQKEEGMPGFREVLRVRGWAHLRRYGSEGMWITIDKIIGNLYPNIFLFFFSIQAPASVMGLLRIAFKLAHLPSSFSLTSISRISQSVIPILMQRGRDVLLQNIRKLVIRTVLLHTVVTAAAMVLISLFLPIVYGESFRPAVFPFLVIVTLNLCSALHTFTTPILRLFSRIYIATIFNICSMALAIGTFFLLQDMLSPIRALYIALAVYNVSISFLVLPTIVLLKRAPLDAR